MTVKPTKLDSVFGEIARSVVDCCLAATCPQCGVTLKLDSVFGEIARSVVDCCLAAICPQCGVIFNIRLPRPFIVRMRKSRAKKGGKR